jgi:hypothetical protein
MRPWRRCAGIGTWAISRWWATAGKGVHRKAIGVRPRLHEFGEPGVDQPQFPVLFARNVERNRVR